jgi:peptidase A4-like protein
MDMVMTDDPKGGAPLQQTLLGRSFSFPLPPPGFDPLTASQADLETYGIMPRPEPQQQELFAAWLRIFAPPVAFVAPAFKEVAAAWQLNTTQARHSRLSLGASRISDSSNWSGAFTVPTHDTMFVLVAGSWVIPTLQMPAPGYQEADATSYVCSTWVGLDGQRRYLDSSLPQIGTMQTLTLSGFAPPAVSAQAFFQWWDRENGGDFLLLGGLPVQPGDLMLGAVWAVGPREAIGYLRNISTGQMAIAGATAPPVEVNGRWMTPAIAGATAEWILERPTIFHETELYPFPDYGTMSFSNCWTGAATVPGPPQSIHDLATARFIRMYYNLQNPGRTVWISMADRQSDTAVRLHYGDF